MERLLCFAISFMLCVFFFAALLKVNDYEFEQLELRSKKGFLVGQATGFIYIFAYMFLLY